MKVIDQTASPQPRPTDPHPADPHPNKRLEEIVGDTFEGIKVARAANLSRAMRKEARKLASQKTSRPGLWRPILKGYYLENLTLDDKYAAQTKVGLARILAAQYLNPQAVFTLESASLVMGCDVRPPNPSLFMLRRADQDRHSVVCPPVWVGDFLVPRAHSKVRSYLKIRPEIIRVNGVSVVSPVDLICQFLRLRAPVDALIAVDSICAKLCCRRRNRQQTERVFAVLLQAVKQRLQQFTGHSGFRRAAELVHYLTPWVESPLESRFRLIALAYGFPSPILQYEVCSGAMSRYVDAFFPDRRLAVELDGRGKYRSSRDLRNEKAREHELMEQGIVIDRFSFYDLRRPDSVARRVSTRLGLSLLGSSVRWDLLEGW